MKYAPQKLSLALLLATISAMLACGPSVFGKKINWPSYVQCAPGVSDVVGTVSAILLGDGTDATIAERGKRELSDLALKHGGDTVACLIERLVSDWTDPGMTQDPVAAAGAARGRAFLREVGTTVRLDEDIGGGF